MEGKAGVRAEILAVYILSKIKKAERIFATSRPDRRLRLGPGRRKPHGFWPMLGLTDRSEATARTWWPSASKKVVRPIALHGTSAAIAGFCGLGDNWADYSKLARKDGVTLAGCWAHSRHKFSKVATTETVGLMAELLVI
jgi:transposase